MLVTPSGIVTLVSLLQPENADDPMLVTGRPPRLEGIAIPPLVDVGTAVCDDEPPPSDASLLDTVYVHVMPSTVAVSAAKCKTENTTKIAHKRAVCRALVFIRQTSPWFSQNS